jgi:hypothetical protein
MPQIATDRLETSGLVDVQPVVVAAFHARVRVGCVTTARGVADSAARNRLGLTTGTTGSDVDFPVVAAKVYGWSTLPVVGPRIAITPVGAHVGSPSTPAAGLRCSIFDHASQSFSVYSTPWVFRNPSTSP